MNNPTVVITHHALSSTAHTAQDVDAWHKLRWPGFVSRYYKNEKGEPYHVGYHFIIEWDGKIIQCRDLHEEGAHTIGMNTSSIGVCFMGNFDTHLPSEEQMKAWRSLYGTLRNTYSRIPTRPHRAYANKSCHGRLLSDDYFTTEKQVATLKEEVKRLMSLLASLIK